MALDVHMNTGNVRLDEAQERRIRRYLQALERRLPHAREPRAEITLREHEAPRRITVDLRVMIAPKTNELVSHQSAETAAHAVRLALEDIERQLERRLATLRGEPAYGVPSRRLPKHLRPNPPA